jgi:GTPase SAR1 family protein
MQLVDTAGQEKYCYILPPTTYRNADAALIVFDLSDPLSFRGIDKRIEDFKLYSKDDSILFIVGAKQDLEPESKVARDMTDK